MADTVSLQAKLRQATKARALRREGWVPGVIYGRGSEATSLQFERRSLEAAAHTAGSNRLVMLMIEGDKAEQMALFRDMQRDPVSNVIQHVDLYSVIAGQLITSTVPVVVIGHAPIIMEGGSVSQLVSELEIECMPKDLPSAIHVDVSVLVSMDSTISLEDLDIPLGVTVLNPPEGEIVRVHEPRGPEPEPEEDTLVIPGLGAITLGTAADAGAEDDSADA